jgi:hypothetical protein
LDGRDSEAAAAAACTHGADAAAAVHAAAAAVALFGKARNKGRNKERVSA